MLQGFYFNLVNLFYFKICPSEANWNQKIAATALMYYLYGTLGFTNVEQNYELMTFNNVQNTMFFAPTWRVWQSHCSDGRENILFLGTDTRSIASASYEFPLF